MSNDSVIHFSKYGNVTPCGTDVLTTAYTFWTPVWPEVTCDACKLEAPMQQVPGRVEYRQPANVTRQDLLERERSLSAELAKVRALLADDDGPKTFPIWEQQGITEQEYLRGQHQLERLLIRRARWVRVNRRLNLREARAAVIDQAHIEALTEHLKRGVRQVSPQDFVDGLAGFAKEQRRQEPLSKPGPY